MNNKTKRILIILGVILLTFVGVSVLYQTLNQKNQADEASLASNLSASGNISPDSSSLSSSGASENILDSKAGASVESKDTTGNSTSDPLTSPKEGLEIGNLAYDFTLNNAVDDPSSTVTLSDLRGKIVLLNFWASWCPPCKQEMPDFQSLHEEYQALGEEADVVILAVNLANGYNGETKEKAQTYFTEAGFTFPIAFDEGELAYQYELYSIPMTYVLDKEGIISNIHLGATTKKVLEKSIEGARK